MLRFFRRHPQTSFDFRNYKRHKDSGRGPLVKGTKVKLSLCLTKHHAMKTYWGSGGIAPRILDLGTRWR
jgi:hypothetical protein